MEEQEVVEEEEDLSAQGRSETTAARGSDVGCGCCRGPAAASTGACARAETVV